MILEYNYDKAMSILELFKNGEIAYLSIKQQEIPDDNPKFIMEYILIKDYPEDKQNCIRVALSNSLQLRLNIVNLLNSFIENQIVNNVDVFNLTFNAVNVSKCNINYTLTYKSKFVYDCIANNSTCNHTDLVDCLDKLDSIINKMKVSNTKIDNIFKREGTGRNKKYTQLTVADTVSLLKELLTED